MKFLLFTGLLTLCLVHSIADEITSLKVTSESIDKFSAALFTQIASKSSDKNVVSSPFSAHIALAMAAYGAGGNTAAQMQKSLLLPSDKTLAQKGFMNLLGSIYNIKRVMLSVANMYLAKSVKVKNEYKQLASDVFHSGAELIDPSTPKDSAAIINKWVADQTNQRIKDIVDDINPSTRMVLVNAIYFKGSWAVSFDKAHTSNQAFHLNTGKQVQVPMMHKEMKIVYGEVPSLRTKFIELPYRDRDVKLYIILPDAIESLKNIEKNLASFNPDRLLLTASKEKVDLYLPKFKTESTIDLKNVIEQLGMTNMFTSAANFNGIADEPLSVSKVLQKTFIEFNEEGTEAAAATAIIRTDMLPQPDPSQPIKFVVNRPFYYVIKTIHVTLFHGHVVNPLV